MQKSDLKTGMIVTTRNGNEYVVFLDCQHLYDSAKNVIVNRQFCCWNDLDLNYTENLTCKNFHSHDIVKVQIPRHVYSFMDADYEKTVRKTIWERQECKEVTMADVEKKFGCKVKIIKEKQNGSEN